MTTRWLPPARTAPRGSPRRCRRRAGSAPAIGTSTTSPAWRSSSFHTPLSPCSVASSSNVARANASGWPRPSSYAHAASFASPRWSISARTVAGGDSGLVAEHQHQRVGLFVDGGKGGRDRGRAALAEAVVLDDGGAAQVDALADLGGAPADHAQQLVEVAGARGGEHVVEQRRVAVGQQLLRGPEPLGAAGGEDEAGDERPCVHMGIMRRGADARPGGPASAPARAHRPAWASRSRSPERGRSAIR